VCYKESGAGREAGREGGRERNLVVVERAKASMSVREVMRMEVPACFIIHPIRSSMLKCLGARPSAPASTNMPSTNAE
jgi:hypothetical protein